MTPPIPLNIDIELASVCNLRCPMCFIPDPKFEDFISQKSDDGKPMRRLMPKEMAFEIIDQAAEIGVPALKFNWRGESTLHPAYSEIVKYARGASIDPFNGGRYYINAKLLGDRGENSPAFHELLANTNANCSLQAIDGLMACTKVMVSLDSMVPETYKEMRVGGDLSKAKNTIWELVRRGHPNIWVRRVITKLNETEDFYGSVKTEWGEKVHVSEHFCFDRNAKEKTEISGCEHDDDIERRYCGYPSQRLIITSTGKAYPCCLDLHETMPVGDFRNQTLLEIWNGEPLKALRGQLKANVFTSKACANCQSWMAYKDPKREKVQDVELKGVTHG